MVRKESMKKVKVIIIGAGSGGLSARREVAKETNDYLVVDGGPLGTTCARVGCMPSKVLIQVAEDFHRREKFLEQGIHGAEGISLNSSEVMRHVRKLRDRFVRGVTEGMESWKNEKLISGYARFVSDNTVEVNGEQIQAEKIILATGTKPIIPEIFKGYERFLITTDEFFELEELPRSMAIIGLGVIGIELGQALARLGVDTLGVARRKNIAGITDSKLNDYVTRRLAENINLSFTGVQVIEERNSRLWLKTQDKEIIADKVLVTTGRVHTLDNLGLEKTSIVLNDKGKIDFNPKTFNILGTDHLFLAGDLTGEKQILHEASDEGRIAGFNAVHAVTAFQTRVPLGITFSDPNIAYVGQTYAQLEEGEIDFEVGEVLFEGQGRSIVKLKEVGMLRVYGHRRTGYLLGAELMAPSGEHLAHLLSWAISKNLTVNETLAMPFYHPVVEEGLRTALRDLRDKVEEMPPKLEIFESEA